MKTRRWTFRAVEPPTDWLRADDMTEVVAADLPTALLCWLIFRGSRLPFTVTRSLPTEQEAAA